MIYLFSILSFVFTLFGGLFALKFKDKLHLIFGFSAGAMIGLVFFDLLPESLELAKDNYQFNNILLITAIGFIIYMIADRFFINHIHTNDDCHNDEHDHGLDHSQDSIKNKRGLLGAGSLSIHSFFDGLAIGLSFQVSNALGMIVALAVLAHDFSDGINTVNFIIKNGGGKKMALRWLITDSISPVIGIVVGSIFSVSSSVLGLILAVFSGFFLYIGASELIPESYHKHPTWMTTLTTVVGIAFLFIIVRLTE